MVAPSLATMSSGSGQITRYRRKALQDRTWRQTCQRRSCGSAG